MASLCLTPPFAEAWAQTREREAASLCCPVVSAGRERGCPGGVCRESSRELGGFLEEVVLSWVWGKCRRWWAPPEVCENSQGAPYLGRELSVVSQVERDPRRQRRV